MGYKKDQYQKTQNLVSKSAPIASPGVNRIKTDGRIGSATPPSYLKGGSASVDNNQKAGPPGNLGTQAMKHMSAGHSGEHYAPRVAKARSRLGEGPVRPHTHPVNLGVKGLKKVKPA